MMSTVQVVHFALVSLLSFVVFTTSPLIIGCIAAMIIAFIAIKLTNNTKYAYGILTVIGTLLAIFNPIAFTFVLIFISIYLQHSNINIISLITSSNIVKSNITVPNVVKPNIAVSTIVKPNIAKPVDITKLNNFKKCIGEVYSDNITLDKLKKMSIVDKDMSASLLFANVVEWKKSYPNDVSGMYISDKFARSQSMYLQRHKQHNILNDFEKALIVVCPW